MLERRCARILTSSSSAAVLTSIWNTESAVSPRCDQPVSQTISHAHANTVRQVNQLRDLTSFFTIVSAVCEQANRPRRSIRSTWIDGCSDVNSAPSHGAHAHVRPRTHARWHRNARSPTNETNAPATVS